MSHNRLTGNIPQKLGSMESLQSLDMSSNQLHGRIPATLAELTFLAFLNVLNNELFGRIPSGRHFDTFGATSFLGNPQLCGPPLRRVCGDYALEGGHDTEPNVYWYESWKAGLGFGCAIGFGSVIGVRAEHT